MLDMEEACEEKSVAALYQNSDVAESYFQRRFSVSWNRLLHETQVAQVNQVIKTYSPDLVVEVAPGPARLTTEIRGVRKGVMVEYSQEMLVEARRRLDEAGVSSAWDVRHGNAFELETQELQSDFLYTFRFLRHFHEEDRGRIYENIQTCLKPKGLLMFDVVNRTVREKLDARNPKKGCGELEVYDVTYSETDFQKEMEKYGFEVLSLMPVIGHFDWQTWISYTLDRRIGKWADRLVRLIEFLPSSHPLEWIALCRSIK